jgi:hypothetical protein
MTCENVLASSSKRLNYIWKMCIIQQITLRVHYTYKVFSCGGNLATAYRHLWQRLTITAAYCSDKIRPHDSASLSGLMTHSAIGSYSSNLWDMLCLLYAADRFPLKLNALDRNHWPSWKRVCKHVPLIIRHLSYGLKNCLCLISRDECTHRVWGVPRRPSSREDLPVPYSAVLWVQQLLEHCTLRLVAQSGYEMRTVYHSVAVNAHKPGKAVQWLLLALSKGRNNAHRTQTGPVYETSCLERRTMDKVQKPSGSDNEEGAWPYLSRWSWRHDWWPILQLPGPHPQWRAGSRTCCRAETGGHGVSLSCLMSP